MEEEKKRRVQIPPYAKRGKRNSVYALKKDMPYFADEEKPRGYLVIGYGTEDPGLMEPSYAYDWYCTGEALIKRKEEIKQREEERLARIRREEEEEAEKKRNLGWTYITADDLDGEISCHPLEGFLCEKFFEETGMGDLLTEVFGKERAFWIRLYTAVFAKKRTGTFTYSLLSEYPMKDHMVFESGRFFTASLWKSITEEERDRFFTEWIKRQAPTRISALACRSVLTLYHDGYSDSWSDFFFGQRMRTGTRHGEEYLLYRDEDTGRLLAMESLKYGESTLDILHTPREIHTIRNSTWPLLRKAGLRLYMHPYHFTEEAAAGQIPLTLCMLPSEYEDGKEIRKRIKELEKVPFERGRRMIRWEGNLTDTPGKWALMEIREKRENVVSNSGYFLKIWKGELQEMSYLEAGCTPYAFYFNIEKENENEDEYGFGFFDEDKFTVKNGKNAAKRLTMDAGRYLFFTNGEEIPDEELFRMQAEQEDICENFREFMNHGETSDLTDDFFPAVLGRDFILFLAQAYREWIFRHMEDLFTGSWDVTQFLRDAGECSFGVEKGGNVYEEERSSWPEGMDRFGVSREDILRYMSENVLRGKYFSDEYKDW